MIPLVPYGKTGAQVTRLGFGAMRLPVTGPDGSVSFDESTRILRRAIELGINFFDSHHLYLDGHSETALGKAFEGLPRDSYFVQSKCADWKAEESGNTWPERLRRGLEKLGCGYYDFYLMHSITWERFEQNGPRFIEVVREAQDQGLVRHFGFSSHDEVPAVIKLIETGHFECMLVQYNYLDTRYAEALSAARQAGMATSVMGPLGGGRFVVPNAFSTVLAPHDGAVASGLRFAFANDDIDVVLSGMRSIEEVDENVSIASDTSPLSRQERARIKQEIAKRTKLAELYCTGCQYCMPCPCEINIAQIFELRNYAEVYGLHEQARRGYARLIEKAKGAPACADCGECEEKCPQKLPIREQLRQTHELLFGDRPPDGGD